MGSPHDPYNSNPPSSGSHYAQLAPCRIYDSHNEVPDESIIHSLEHGAVWISYRDADDIETIERLEELAARYRSHIVLNNRPDNETKIALAAWQNVLSLDEFDERQISNFIARFRQNGPEAAPC